MIITYTKTCGFLPEMKCNLAFLGALIWGFQAIWAQNPLIRDQYTVDPTARVFNNKLYVYPSHDIMCTEDKGEPGWFCMEDYHVFSSKDLTIWKDHGEILHQKDLP